MKFLTKDFFKSTVELLSGRTNCTTAKIKIVSMKYEEKNYQQKKGKKKYIIYTFIYTYI